MTPPGIRHEDERAAALERYKDWHDPIPDLIKSAEVVLHHDINALPEIPATLYAGRLVLVGDAGHGMSPHLGQGGCTAIEDAVVLAAELARDPEDVPAALARYSAQRQPRVSENAQKAEEIRKASNECTESDTLERNRTWPLMSSADIYRTSVEVAHWFPPAIVEA